MFERLLSELFDELDLDHSGFLDTRAFVLLGEAMNGHPVSAKEARIQLGRADRDGDEVVSRQEWLDFSAILMRLEEYMFKKTIQGYIEKVREIKDKRFG
jgi:hypothetical protein